MSDKIKLFEMASDKLANDPEFMSFYLNRFQEIENINQDTLCSQLKCSFEQYYKLALCRVPEANNVNFINRLNNISDHTGISVIGLNDIIKRVNSILALAMEDESKYLIAARDKNRSLDKDNSDGSLNNSDKTEIN